MNLKDHIRSIKDYPKKGILFRDITTLIKNEKAFAKCIDEIVNRSKKFKFDKIAAIESRGFVFASAVSNILKKPFILLREKNKLPAATHSVEFELAAKLIEISKGKIAGFIFVINLFDLGGYDNLIKKGHKVENLIDFPGH